MTLRRAFGALGLTFLLVGSPSCAKPKAPQLTPKEATFSSIDLAGFNLRVKMDAFNPNSFALSVRAISARVVIDGTQDLGLVTVSSPMSLAANSHTALDVPLAVKWTSLGTLASLAAARRSVPYAIDGTATVGGESLNLDVPFKFAGTLTERQLAEVAAKSMQGIPGLFLPK